MLNVIIPIYGFTKDNRNSISNDRVDILDHVNDKSILSWSLTHIEQYNEPKRYFIISTDKYIQDNSPWYGAKQQNKDAHITLCTTLHIGKICIKLLKPIQSEGN